MILGQRKFLPPAISAIRSCSCANLLATWEWPKIRAPHCARVVNLGGWYIFAFKPRFRAIPNENFLSSCDVFYGLESVHRFLSALCMYVCMHTYRILHAFDIWIRALKIHTHLKITPVCSWKYRRYHIGTIVVVEKRAVIENQQRVRLVVAKDIIAHKFGTRIVVWQEKCSPQCRHLAILFFEIASCKDPNASCLNEGTNFNLVEYR